MLWVATRYGEQTISGSCRKFTYLYTHLNMRVDLIHVRLFVTIEKETNRRKSLSRHVY